MPSYREHVATGCVVYVATSICLHSYIPPSASFRIELFLCTFLGSLFPDIDTKSKGQQLFYLLSLLLILLLITQKHIILALIIALCAFLPLLCKHRGLFHDPLFLFFSIGCVSMILLHRFPSHRARLPYDILFFTCGVLSHILLDSFITTRKLKYYKK